MNDNITVCYTQIIKDKQGTSGTSGTSVKPMRFTYTVSVANKTIVYKGSKELSTFIINKVENTLVKNKICEEAQDLGYITSENRSIACYKKIKGEK